LEDIARDERIILKWILKKWDGEVRCAVCTPHHTKYLVYALYVMLPHHHT
jgi:hypothetical protein